MAQVDTQSAFRHPSQHSSYYYPTASSSHSGSSSSSNSHPRSQNVNIYYTRTQHCYSPENNNSYTSYRDTYVQSRSELIEENIEEYRSPFPAYEHAMSSHTPTPEPIEDEEEEEDYDELEEDEETPSESSNSFKSSSPTAAFPHVSDDIWTERGPGPSRQVDYLSHDWQEPDIWSSWRYVRKEKPGYPQNAARLENASWRTWAKSKYKLKTITPETLNWLKDCDVTWLYGPLHSQVGALVRSHTEPTSPAVSEPDMLIKKMSRSSSFSTNTPQKPILKKRSHSEIMLSSWTGKTQENLLSRAARAVQEERLRELEEQELREEQRKNPLTPTHILQQRIRRKGSAEAVSRDSPDSPFAVNKDGAPARTDYFGHGIWTSSSASGGQTPSAQKHIHFNDRVEQCIAVDKDDEDAVAVDEDSEEEGLFMMRGSRQYHHKTEHSTIAKLPATSLRPPDEPIRELPQIAYNLPIRSSKDDLQDHAGFYYEEGGGFSSTASPPEFPPRPHYPLDDKDPMDDFSFDHPFASQSLGENMPSNNTSTTSSRRPSDLDLEDSQRLAHVSTIPISASSRCISRDSVGLMGEDEEDEGMGIVGLAADAISTAKDLVGVLWNAGWGGRR